MVTQCSDFDTVRKQTAAARPYFARAESEIRERQQRAMTRVVPAGFVPRVATLSIAYQLPDFEGDAGEIEPEVAPQTARSADTETHQTDVLSRTSSAAVPPAAVERQRSRSLASQQAAVISAMASAQQSSAQATSASLHTGTTATPLSSVPWQLERTPFAASVFGTPNPSHGIQPQYAAPMPAADAPRFAFRPFTVGHF
jgi:hypothetical protein